jgi:multidrug resistance efflux pump
VKIGKFLNRNNIILSTAGLIILLVLLKLTVKPGAVDLATFPVTKGEFIVSIVQKGEILAKNSETISVPEDVHVNNIQIVYLATEGSRIKKGDILVMFDTSELDTRIEDREAQVVSAKEELEKLKASQASQMSSLMSSLEVTKNNYELSKIRLQQMQFEAETKKQMEDLNFKNAEISLKRQEETIKNQKIINGVDFKNAQLRINRQEMFLKQAKDEREKLIIRAPMDGLVVYKENFRSTTREKFKVGDTPVRRMPLIELPDLSVMQVKTSINEIDIRKVERGQKAVIRLDAVQNAVFTGIITDIAYLARRERSSNVKVFDVIITIDGGENQLLKPGMSSTVEIITEKIDSEKYIPIESVFEKEGKTIAYVVGSSGSSWNEREVKVGKTNNNYIVVEGGLEEGEKVALRDPTVQLEKFGTEIKAQPQKKSTSSQGNVDMQEMRQMREIMGGGSVGGTGGGGGGFGGGGGGLGGSGRGGGGDRNR